MLCSLWDRWVVTTPIYSTEIFCMRWEVHMEGTRGNVFMRCHTFYSMEIKSGKIARECRMSNANIFYQAIIESLPL